MKLLAIPYGDNRMMAIIPTDIVMIAGTDCDFIVTLRNGDTLDCRTQNYSLAGLIDSWGDALAGASSAEVAEHEKQVIDKAEPALRTNAEAYRLAEEAASMRAEVERLRAALQFVRTGLLMLGSVEAKGGKQQADGYRSQMVSEIDAALAAANAERTED